MRNRQKRQIQVTASRQDQTASKQFKKYLTVGANKTELLQFLLNDWQDQQHIANTKKKRILAMLRNETYVINVIDREIVKQCITALCSNQEEADRIMLLASKIVSSRGCNSESIQTVASDAAISAFYYAPMLSSHYIKIGAGKNESILNVTDAPFQKNFLKPLPGLHAFS